MKTILFKFIFLLSFIILLDSCDSGPKPVEIEGLNTYKDEVTTFSIKYPKNWKMSSVPGARFVVFSHDQIRGRFNNYDTKGFPGAKIDLVVSTLDSVITLDTILAKSKLFPPETYEEANISVDGVEGKKLVYSFPLEGGMFNGIIVAATKDGKRATTLVIECFDDTYETYKSSIDEIIGSLVLATAPEKKVDTIIQVEDAEPPSQTLDVRSGEGFTLGIPDNFGSENIGKSASALKAWSFLGKRRGDSYIKVEMFDSKKQDLKKIVDEVKGSLPGATAAQKTSISGKDAFIVNYKPAGQVKGRVYLTIKDTHLYRITLNWFVGEEKDFLPIFEKSVASFKFN